MRKIFLLVAALAAALALCGTSAYAKKEKVNLMSFNIRIQFPADTGKFNWESRKDGCAKAIRKQDPDIIGLQEATAEQKSFIMKELSKHIMIDGSAKPGTVNNESESGFNPILFRADRFELLDYGTVWLNENQEQGLKGWDAEYARSANWVKLCFRKSGQIIFFFNTHLDNSGAKSRQESSDLIVLKVKEIAGDNAVVFLAGDLNATTSDKTIKPLTTYFKEASKTVKKADKASSFNDFGRKGGKKESIDHILYRNAEAEYFNVVDEPKYGIKYISDHYPVTAGFVITLPKD